MNILKFIKENIFRIKPIFKIEIKESWFSKDWVYIRYSPNNGWKLRVLITYNYDTSIAAWDKYKVDIEYIKINEVKEFIDENQLNTFENCEKYNEKVYKMIKEHNEREYNEYVNNTQPGRDFVKQFNKK
jgi:hypothetical protein